MLWVTIFPSAFHSTRFILFYDFCVCVCDFCLVFFLSIFSPFAALVSFVTLCSFNIVAAFFFFTLCLFNCSFMFLSISVSSSFMNLLTYTFLEYWFSFNMALFLLFVSLIPVVHLSSFLHLIASGSFFWIVFLSLMFIFAFLLLFQHYAIVICSSCISF